MQRGFWLIFGLVCGFALTLSAEEVPDTLKAQAPVDTLIKEPAILYVIPAGPIAGSFTEQSRVQVVDTVAGWARILVEGWVPVDKVVARMSGETLQPLLGEIEKPAKVKPERPQCIAKTAKGKQCTRKAIPGSKKCWQHSQ